MPPHTAPRSRNPLLFFALACYFLTMLPRMLSLGMFFDGVTYASISRNLAEGVGSAWAPQYTATYRTVFCEHPPMHFWLQSLAFRLFGDYLWIEQFWGFVLGLVILALLALIWRAASDGRPRHAGVWFPVLLLVTVPFTSWILSNNMLEILQTVFTTAAVYCALRAAQRSSLVLSLTAGLLVLCAVLTKGPVGLFPLAAPIIVWLWLRASRLSHSVLQTATMVVALVGGFGILLWLSPGALDFFKQYYHDQIVTTVAGQGEPGADRLAILKVIGREIIVPVMICVFAMIADRLKTLVTQSIIADRRFGFFVFLALTASLPILISPKQYPWYAYSSFPFYVLAVASLWDRLAMRIEDALARSGRAHLFIWSVGVVLAASAILGMLTERDVPRKARDFHRDFTVQPMDIPPRQIMSVYPASLLKDWELVANMQREFRISLTEYPGAPYLITVLDSVNAPAIVADYHRLHPPSPARWVVFGRN